MTESGGGQVARAFVAAVWVWLALPGSLLSPVDAALRPSAQDADHVPTYTADVAPILFGHCVNCHRPGQAARLTTTML